MAEPRDIAEDSDAEEGADDMVRQAAMQWASDWLPGQPPPYGVHRHGDREPPTYRATVSINGRAVCGPFRDTIEECILDRRQLLIQYRRVTKMSGKKKTQPKYVGENSALNIFSGLKPWMTHFRDLLFSPRISPDFVPPARHLCPVSLAVKIHGVAVSDRFLWSALLIDNFSRNPVAEALGYGAATLHAYCGSLLVDAGIVPTYEFVTQLSAAVIQQLELHRAASLVPDEYQCIEKSKGRRFDRYAKIEISDENVHEKFLWNCWAPDSIAKEFIAHFVAESSIKPSSAVILEMQLLTQAIAHRQRFLDVNPHIHTAMQRVFTNKRQDGRMQAKRQERLKLRAAKRQRETAQADLSDDEP